MRLLSSWFLSAQGARTTAELIASRRKLLEPFEISKAEREINKGLLEKLSTQMTTSAKR